MIGTISAVMAVMFGVLGLLIGSFLNVVVYRIPRRESVVVGRSHCPACGHVLSPLDLVPVLSFLVLGRRCRYCQAPISPRYAIVESLTAMLFATAAFALSWTGLNIGWSDRWLAISPFLYVAVLSVPWTWYLMRSDRKSTASSQSASLKNPMAIGLLIATIQIILPLLLIR